ncbi:putative mfs multidrug protein [Acrodontium crateriforme]|uniref:Cercosporin MFS transporter CTB4 n=1 Tax=Acrodontium crateriforme TaxID=150365 RepID=A0AAQ3M8Z1_9PEZI|nr:putative mfs multidrug protein [Acrodontium crateriforme]
MTTDDRQPRSINESGASNFSEKPEKEEDLPSNIEDEPEVDVEKQQSPSPALAAASDEENDPNLITWSGPDDPENPMNWPKSKKWLVTMVLGSVTFVCTFASSVFSTATVITSEKFHVSTEVMTLGTSLFVLGFAWGPIVWGPFSELFGRKTPLFAAYFVFAIFNIPVAVAQNVETIMICRFLSGFFACAPLVIVGGTLADFWDPVDRGVAMCFFTGATFIGPTMGPIIGGFITQSSLGWRWTAWITLIMTAFFGIIAVFIIPETFAPVILQQRAKRIRFETKNWAIHAKHDEKEIDLKEILTKYLTKPFVMMAQEPILLLMTLYMALIYGLIYLCFEAFPISFQEQRGWNGGVGALPFISLMVGVILGLIVTGYLTKTRFARKLKQEGRVVPEERLIPMIIGGAALPIGLFWFGWTSSPGISPWPQIIAAAPIGFGVILIFLQGLNYIIDCYLWQANSAIAANTFVRSWVGAGFPMFASAMFHKLGVPWATSLLAFLCVALFPVPVLFYIYGAKIRKMSKFSPY